MRVWRLLGRFPLVVPILLIGLHWYAAPAVLVDGVAAASSQATISSHRESLPRPVHDESTCAFCQAAAFAPYSARPADGLALAVGGEQRIHLTYDSHLTHNGSARPPRSRAPPVIRSV
jgi:hypothetical protein